MKSQVAAFLFVLCFILGANAQQGYWIDFNNNGQMDIYEDPDARIDIRVNDLLSKMTVYEKIQILHEVAPAIPRLGISKYDHGNEALHGIVRPGKFTVFPQAIGLAATWNPDLIFEVSTAISDEARARWNELEQGKLQFAKYSDLLTFWSPTVNMARDPRWGRTPETYGEDPYLTSRIGVSFVKGLQGTNSKYLKVVSTPKHFAGNNEEHNRFECKAEISEQALRSYYLPAFKALVTEGNAQSIMTAYNAINGVPCTANKWLLTDILRNEWGFDGYVVSDCGAPGFLYTPHNYVPIRIDAAVAAIKAGLDLECSGYCSECFIFRDYLPKAYETGKVTASEINRAAFRVLRARFKLGIFDAPKLNPYSKISPSVVGSIKHQELVLETARQSMVLLKNENNVLPLKLNEISSIAVMGINANSCEFGDYSGKPLNKPVSPFEGIKALVGNKAIVKTIEWEEDLFQFKPVHGKFVVHDENNKSVNGFKAEYFDNADFEGTGRERIESQVAFNLSNQLPNPIIPNVPMSVRWTGNIIPKISGEYTFATKFKGNIRFYINDKLLINKEQNETYTGMTDMELISGQKYSVKIEYSLEEGNGSASFLWKTPGMEKVEKFIKEKELSRNSDVVIAVMGINKSIEREGIDREFLGLPRDQMEFIREIHKANPKTIVVLVAGSSLTVNWIQDNIPAIIDAWYPGEQGGNAIAEVLFGKYNPAGRLPLTFYKNINDLPPFDDYDVFNGRTYMYFDKKPLYAFGFGLSYTKFEYSNIRVDKRKITPGNSIKIEIDIKNTGIYDGDEVVQLYLNRKDAHEKVPVKELKAFKRIFIKCGEEQTLSFTLNRRDMSYWNCQNEFKLHSGTFNIMIGASSDNILQKTQFEVLPQIRK
jgi:beta-glucosidase